MKKKKIVIALGHEALGNNLPKQHEAVRRTAKAVLNRRKQPERLQRQSLIS